MWLGEIGSTGEGWLYSHDGYVCKTSLSMGGGYDLTCASAWGMRKPTLDVSGDMQEMNGQRYQTATRLPDGNIVKGEFSLLAEGSAAEKRIAKFYGKLANARIEQRGFVAQEWPGN